MKKFNLFTIAVLLALLATSCSKEEGRFSLVANQMRSHSKILMNDAYNGSWVAGEKVLLNGVGRTIAVEDDKYYLDGDAPVSGTPYQAIYPFITGGSDADGNVVSIVGNTMTITNLVVDFVTGGYKVMFPMASSSVEATSSGCRLLFDHATAALKLTLKNKNMSEGCTLSSIKVFTQASSTVTPLSTNSVTALWKVQGPSVPVGEIGGINGDQTISNGCEMNFTLKTNNVPNKLFEKDTPVSFCVPVTVNKLNKISVIGYDQDGKQVFTRTKELGSDQTINANIIYPVPTIEF